MNHPSSSERGQAIVILVLAMVVLLGFTALAIDGGMIYSERRHAQNAADAAALAGALQKSNNQTDVVIKQAIWNVVAANNYTLSQMSAEINGPLTDFTGKYYLITVSITSKIDSALAHFVYRGPLETTVKASAKVQPSEPPLDGHAIIAMGNCLLSGTGSLVGVTGGGVSGGVQAFGAGIFLNTPENSSNACAISPPNNGYGITSDVVISSVGSHTYAGETMVSPVPINTTINGGLSIGDPLANLPEPVCTGNGSISGGLYQPGNWNGSAMGGGAYAPGIYCITGDVKLGGLTGIIGDGLVFYFINGGMQFTGNAGLTISAPDAGNCLGTAGDPSASCTYKGVAIFAARTNTSTIEVRGNGGDAVTGLIYALRGTVQARGGGTTADETVVNGQIISNQVLGNGNGSFKVNYIKEKIFWETSSINLHQ